jgi:hypothetical protein
VLLLLLLPLLLSAFLLLAIFLRLISVSRLLDALLLLRLLLWLLLHALLLLVLLVLPLLLCFQGCETDRARGECNPCIPLQRVVEPRRFAVNTGRAGLITYFYTVFTVGEIRG